MDISALRKNLPAIDAAAGEMLGLFGPGFTGTQESHVETDIAAAASLAGLLMLRSKGFELSTFKPGTAIFTELDTEMEEIWGFMAGVCRDLGLDPSSGWTMEIPETHKPLFSIPEMTQKIEKVFLAICGRHELQPAFFPYVAAMAALKMVAKAHADHRLDQDTGKALTGYYVVAGAKTVPFS